MGIAKKTDGRYVVGVGVENANDYKGSAAYRDIYIQLTSSGATEQSEEYLTFLKDYAVNANALGEPIMPPSVNVWISNNGVTTAVEADDVSIDGNNYTICGIKWNGSTWDYSGAGQGKSGSGLPPYTSADKGKVLTVGEGSETVQTVIVPEQTVNLVEGAASLSNVAITYDDLVVGDTATLHISDGVQSNEYEMTVTADTSGEDTFLYYLYTSDTEYYQILDHPQNGWIIFAEGIEHTPLSGEYTVSLVKTVTSVEPKWEAAGGIEVISIGSVTASNGADNAIYVNGQELTTLEECAEYLESVQDKVLYVQMTGLPEGAIFKSIVTGITVYRAANYAYGEFVQKMPSLNAQTFGYMPASD